MRSNKQMPALQVRVRACVVIVELIESELEGKRKLIT